MTSFSELPPADQEAIGKTLLTLLEAFDDRDAEPLLGVYSDDADRVNAFGTVKRGRDEIVEYLRGLFPRRQLQPRRACRSARDESQ